jgi:hypothetical protein
MTVSGVNAIVECHVSMFPEIVPTSRRRRGRDRLSSPILIGALSLDKWRNDTESSLRNLTTLSASVKDVLSE